MMTVKDYLKNGFLNFYDKKSNARSLQYEGTICKTCKKTKMVRIYYAGEQFDFMALLRVTTKCVCGVAILYANGVYSFIHKDDYKKEM